MIVKIVTPCVFCRLWTDLLPHIRVTKPRSDLCWMCHQNSTAIMKVANKLDDDKAKVLHITAVQITHVFLLFYTNCVLCFGYFPGISQPIEC